MDALASLLDKEPYLVLDGAMGTLLMKAGLPSGAAPEEWNLSEPDHIRGIHLKYLRAGARVILTNSFGGNSFRLERHGLAAKTFELNQAAAQFAGNARDLALPESPCLVAGSMGPTGEMMEPLGTLTPKAARDGFAEQAAGLTEGGADLLWIETMSDLREARAAFLGARDRSELPIAVTMTFDAGGWTMMGTTPEQALSELIELGPAAFGANCGNGPKEIEGVMSALVELDPGVPLIAKSNAGKPTWIAGELVYDGTPAVMAQHATRLRDMGVRLIGGCCGTDPEHIRAMAKGLAEGR
jgi:5-methyltetrahydrofolate--homocysteine methyltransferase